MFFLLSTLASYISMLITVNILASVLAHSRLELILDSGICKQIEKGIFLKKIIQWVPKKSYFQNAAGATVHAPAQSLVAGTPLCLEVFFVCVSRIKRPPSHVHVPELPWVKSKKIAPKNAKNCILTPKWVKMENGPRRAKHWLKILEIWVVLDKKYLFLVPKKLRVRGYPLSPFRLFCRKAGCGFGG